MSPALDTLIHDLLTRLDLIEDQCRHARATIDMLMEVEARGQNDDVFISLSDFDSLLSTASLPRHKGNPDEPSHYLIRNRAYVLRKDAEAYLQSKRKG